MKSVKDKVVQDHHTTSATKPAWFRHKNDLWIYKESFTWNIFKLLHVSCKVLTESHCAHYPFSYASIHIPPILADRSSQQVRRGPPGCLSAVLCPIPLAGSWRPHHHHFALPWILLRPWACPSQPACAGASRGSRHSSQSAATPDSWPTEEIPSVDLWVERPQSPCSVKPPALNPWSKIPPRHKHGAAECG